MRCQERESEKEGGRETVGVRERRRERVIGGTRRGLVGGVRGSAAARWTRRGGRGGRREANTSMCNASSRI